MKRMTVIFLLVAMFFLVKTMLDIRFLEEQAILGALLPTAVDISDASENISPNVSPKRLYEDMNYVVGRAEPAEIP
jgi:hypothetical protein